MGSFQVNFLDPRPCRCLGLLCVHLHVRILHAESPGACRPVVSAAWNPADGQLLPLADWGGADDRLLSGSRPYLREASGSACGRRGRLCGCTGRVNLASQRWCPDCPSVSRMSCHGRHWVPGILCLFWLPMGLLGPSRAIFSILSPPCKTVPNIF